MKKEIFESYDGKKLACFLWDDIKKPKGVVQIIHGMTSHMGRFCDLGEALNRMGYIAYGDDHRPHGQTAGLNNLGKASKHNFDENVQDEIEITKMLKKRFSLPVLLFSHSYGSFLAQAYITKEPYLIDALILSGSSYMGKKKLFFGKLLTALQRLKYKMDEPNRMFFEMTFESNNKPFEDEGIKNAWLSRDKNNVALYNADPYCNFLMTHGFYYSMMRGLFNAYKKSSLHKIKKDLPILIMSGSCDPLGGMGKKVTKLYEMYQHLGLTDLSLTLYEGLRHELISDSDSALVLKDIHDFYDRAVTGSQPLGKKISFSTK